MNYITTIPPRVTTKGYLYLIASATFQNYIKIGKTIEPHKRLCQYNSYNPNNDFGYIYISQVFDDYTDAEDELLLRLRRQNIKPMYNREWFDIQCYDTILKTLQDLQLDG